MKEFKWELPFWCPRFGQARSFGPGRWVIFEGNELHCFQADGHWDNIDNSRLRNGIMPYMPYMPETDWKWITISKEGDMDYFETRAEAEDDQRQFGGVIIDLEKIGPEAIVQPKRERTVWVNIFNNSIYGTLSSGAYESKEKADASTGVGRIACVPVTFTEGDGLS